MATSSRPKVPRKGRQACCSGLLQAPWLGQAFTQGLIPNPGTLLLESETHSLCHSLRPAQPWPSPHRCELKHAGEEAHRTLNGEKSTQPTARPAHENHLGSVTSPATQATLQSNEIRISRDSYQAYTSSQSTPLIPLYSQD